jgi:signal transduction histidine kinase
VNDYILKDRLTRLVPAIERELREAALRAERNSMQEQLVLSDRLASVGTLAAGVAHEINNPLAAVTANLDYISGELARDPSELAPDGMQEFIEALEPALVDAREAANRIRQIVKDLLGFSRSDADQVGPVDVRRVLEFAARMVAAQIRSRARFVQNVIDLPPVLGNEGRLGQVFLNLLINATQAIPEGMNDRNEIRVSARLDGQRVVVEVSDSGQGIPREIVHRIFDPFFTTKPIGVGTGLGLAICHRIVQSLGGEISVESEVDKGTTFRVSLPALAVPALSSEKPAAAAPARKARMLVVDDEPIVVTAVRRLLAHEHEIAGVTSAEKAIELIKNGARYDVILCDLVMPVKTGIDLYEELSKLVPEQAERMVFATGGAFTRAMQQFLERVANPRVDKPFDLQKLRAIINQLCR